MLTKKQAVTNAEAWYPGGSKFTGVTATKESKLKYKVGDEIP